MLAVPLGFNLRRSLLAIEKKPHVLLTLLSWENNHLGVPRRPLLMFIWKKTWGGDPGGKVGS